MGAGVQWEWGAWSVEEGMKCVYKNLETSKMQYVPSIALIMLFVCYSPLITVYLHLIKLYICTAETI